MGFIVKQPIETINGKYYSEFYVRIEGYQVFKPLGELGVTIAHYESDQAAKDSIPDYLEDQPTGLSGPLPVIFTYSGETKEWPMWYNFSLTEKVTFTDTIKKSSRNPENIEYVDFDEFGNEVIKTREEWIETITYETFQVEKTLKNINLINGSLYEYAYNLIKEIYGNIFGSDNIIDLR